MEYKLIVSRAMFVFAYRQEHLRLASVRFLSDHQVQHKGSILIVRNQHGTEEYLDGTVRLASLTREQFRFLAAASRLLGNINPRKMRVYLWSGTHETGEPAEVLLAAA